MKALKVFIGLALANFFIQLVGEGHYLVALERSYFQGVALITYMIIDRFLDKSVDIDRG
jgi:hypothetical protein